MSTDSPQQRLSGTRILYLKEDGPGILTFAEWHDLCDLALKGLLSETAPTQIGHESTQDGHGDKSETPRTDAYEKEVPVVGTLDQAHRAWGELCRMLERELNAARSAIAPLICPRCGDEWRGQACVADCPLHAMAATDSGSDK